MDVAAYDAHEAFYLDLRVFVSHVAAVADSPENACELHGCYNVAHEFWYFIPRCDLVAKNPLQVVPPMTHEAIARLIETIVAIPDEARSWTTTKAGSLQNMSHPAWNAARQQAKELMSQLRPTVAKMNAFFELPNPSFKPTPQGGAA